MRTDANIGPWLSFGFHVDFKNRHVDIHFIWWTFVIGNTVEPIHCGYCEAEMGEGDVVCPACGADFNQISMEVTDGYADARSG